MQYTQYDIRKTQYELWYPFVGEFAGLIKKQNHVNVGHHLLMINTKNTPVPSIPFSSRLTQLLPGTTAEGQENQGHQNNTQNHLTYGNRNASHHFSLFEIQ